jgi:ParB/RepB/Spo0J family partition protein
MTAALDERPAAVELLDAPQTELLPIDSIAPSTTHIQTLRRARYDPEKILELAASLKTTGLLQPILVRPKNHGSYELVAGERRWLAAARAGFAHIAAHIRPLTDAQVIEAQLVENLQRDDLQALEEAEGYKALMELKGIDADEVAALIGKSRSYVYARRKLLDLCPAGRDALQAGRLDASKALLLARFKGDALQLKALKVLVETNWRGETISYKSAFETLRDKFMIPLGTAPWALDDDTLFRFEKVLGKRGQQDCIALPACLECPHFSGNDAELRRDLGDAHVCTDPACHAAKLACVADRPRQQAEAAGVPIVTGEDAKKIAPRKDALVGYVDLDEECPADEFPEPEPEAKDDAEEDSPEFKARFDAWNDRYDAYQKRTYRQLLGEHKLEVKLLEDPKTRKIRELVPIKEARALLAKQHEIKLPGYVGQRPPAQTGSTDWAEQQRQANEEHKAREEREERELDYRRAVFAAIAEKCAGPLKRDDLVDIADVIIESRRGETAKVLAVGFGGKRPEPGQMKEADLPKLIRLALIIECCMWAGRSPGPLLAAAKRYKIDTGRIKKQLADAEKTKAKPAGAKAATKGKTKP